MIPVAVRAHPILRGVGDVWGPTDVYGIRDLPLDSLVLLEGSVRAGMEPDSPAVEGEKNEPRMPIAWLRERALVDGRLQRVVCSTIGSSTDLQSVDLRRMLINGCYWCVGLEDAISVERSVDTVGPYDPTPFGFDGHTRGVRPSDHGTQ
ncbi:MAG: ThuA domain-containing protein [bacterium]|nr:ThuA domain-containing protein [bacterium]